MSVSFAITSSLHDKGHYYFIDAFPSARQNQLCLNKQFYRWRFLPGSVRSQLQTFLNPVFQLAVHIAVPSTQLELNILKVATALKRLSDLAAFKVATASAAELPKNSQTVFIWPPRHMRR